MKLQSDQKIVLLELFTDLWAKSLMISSLSDQILIFYFMIFAIANCIWQYYCVILMQEIRNGGIMILAWYYNN